MSWLHQDQKSRRDPDDEDPGDPDVTMQPPELTDHVVHAGNAARAAAGDTSSRRADKICACTSLKYAGPG
jgi:hypothetical protein